MSASIEQRSPASDVEPLFNEERKLWLDYLRSLNDQRAQAAQRTGLTSYGLLAIEAGLLYRYVPRVPALLAEPRVFDSSLIVLGLEFSILFFFIAAHVFLLAYCGLDREHRVLPEAKGRIGSIGSLLIILVWVGLGMFQLWTGIRMANPDMVVKGWLITSGVIWILLTTVRIASIIVIYRKVKAYKIPWRHFSSKGLKPDQNLRAAALFGCIFMLSLLILIRYLADVSSDWVTPLGASSIALTSLVIFAELFSRSFNRVELSTHQALERDILLDQLQPGEIRNRYIRDSLGTDTRDWLERISAELFQEVNTMRAFCDSIHEKLEEIERLDRQ